MTVSALKAKPKQRSSSGWSPERRAKHAASIKLWAPWAKSTGPRTTVGKARSAMNAYKHGGRRAALRFFAAALARNSRFLRGLNQFCRLRKNNPANELLKMMEFRLMLEGQHVNMTFLWLQNRLIAHPRREYWLANDG